MDQTWREMHEFAGIDLEDSRVLGWSYESPPGRLVVQLEARLLPGHPDYVPPLFGEPACNTAAELVFEGVSYAFNIEPPLVALSDPGDGPPRIETLAYLRRDDDGGYSFDASWGTISVYCDDVELRLDGEHREAA